MQLRSRVYSRDDYRCVYCGSPWRALTADHKIPIGRNGESTMENLVTACVLCNEIKGDMTAEEFLALPRCVHVAECKYQQVRP